MERVREVFYARGLPSLRRARSLAKANISDKSCEAAVSHVMSYWKDHTRPALMSLACETVGGDPTIIEEIGSSMILMAAGIDIHDDIIDRSLKKDYGQTVLGISGVEITLILGDVLIVKGLTSLPFFLVDQDIPPQKTKTILTLVENLLVELSDAEAGELRLRGNTCITPRKYLRLTRMKAADVEAYMRIGAILGEGSEVETEVLGRYGRALGMIIILRDDLSDMLDFKDELPHRIEYEHLPLPILYALENPKYRKRIKSLLCGSKIQAEEAEELFKITYEAGGLAGYERAIKRLARICRRQLDSLSPSEARSTLNDVVDVTAPPPLSNLEF